MITLALDTSTACGTVALLRDETVLAEHAFWREGLTGNRNPSQTEGDATLFSTIRRLLNEQRIAPADIGLFAVGLGPGSFTGIRVGIAAAKGLALPLGRPIQGVCSFDALALTARPLKPRDCEEFCVLCDARRDEVYFALYADDGQPRQECRIGTLQSIADQLRDPIWFVSPDLDRFRQPIAETMGGFANLSDGPMYPRAATLGQLAVRLHQSKSPGVNLPLEPIYLRTPQYKTLAKT